MKTEAAGVIESWRYAGPPTEWTATVGHVPQIRRAQELVEKLSRSEEELARLRLRIGAGMVISGLRAIEAALSPPRPRVSRTNHTVG